MRASPFGVEYGMKRFAVLPNVLMRQTMTAPYLRDGTTDFPATKTGKYCPTHSHQFFNLASA